MTSGRSGIAARAMPVAKFVSTDEWLWSRQTPNGDGVIGGVRFAFDLACSDYDFLVVFNDVPARFADRVRRNRTVFVGGEPTTFKRYDRRFLGQFGTIVASDADTGHPNRIASHGSSDIGYWSLLGHGCPIFAKPRFC